MGKRSEYEQALSLLVPVPVSVGIPDYGKLPNQRLELHLSVYRQLNDGGYGQFHVARISEPACEVSLQQPVSFVPHPYLPTELWRDQQLAKGALDGLYADLRVARKSGNTEPILSKPANHLWYRRAEFP